MHRNKKSENKKFQKRQLSSGQKSVVVVSFIICVLFEFVLLINLSALNENRSESVLNEQIAAAESYGESVAAGLLLTLDKSITISQVLKDLYLDFGETFTRDFNLVCSSFCDENPVIGSLYIAPQGIITVAYPPEVEQATIGFNMLEDFDQGPTARLARDTGKITVCGPFKLLEGGTGFIIRNPIYKNNKFLGFTVIVLDWEQYIAQAMNSLGNNNSGYNFAVWKEDLTHIVTDSHNYLFSNNPDVIVDKTIDIELPVPNDTWHLSIEPVGGWQDYESVNWVASILVCVIVTCLITGFSWYRQIITAEKMWNMEHDALTGVYTRSAFYRRCRRLLKAYPQEDFDVLVADIENFKVLNGIYGAARCDQLLCYIADNLSTDIEDSVCGRYGGDQFILFFRTAECKGHKYLEYLNDKFNHEGPIHNFVIKYGYYNKVDRSIPINLIADRALMAAKSILHNYEITVARYDGPVSRRHYREQLLESSFEAALKNEDFKVWFQPKFDANTEKIVGAEALVRWIYPDGTVVPPSDFIYIFEEDGLIVHLDLYVFKKVCKIIRSWQDNGSKIIPISVNLSRASLHHAGIINNYVDVIKESGIPINSVSLELTESTAYSNQQIKNLAESLKTSGFKLDMDDFGTGSSSLASLNILPFDVIKLDKSLVDFIGTPHGDELLRHTIELAHFKGIKVIAEGVENKAQLEFLRGKECDVIQGYYYSKPLSYEDFIAFINKLDAEGRV